MLTQKRPEGELNPSFVSVYRTYHAYKHTCPKSKKSKQSKQNQNKHITLIPQNVKTYQILQTVSA